MQYIKNHLLAADQRWTPAMNQRRSLSDKPDERGWVSMRVIENPMAASGSSNDNVSRKHREIGHG